MIKAETRKLTIDDFLIISPYNTQVNLLISKLEESKFKIQE